jgi:hypothetical protein
MDGQRDKSRIDVPGTAVGVVDMQACLAVGDTTQSLDLLATATGYAQRARARALQRRIFGVGSTFGHAYYAPAALA